MNVFVCLFVCQINEYVDARDLNMGAWFEAQIVNVTKMTRSSAEGDDQSETPAAEEEVEEIRYHVKYEE